MDTNPSIESLREGLTRIAGPAQGMDELEPDFQAQSAALSELEAYRKAEATLIAERDQWRRYAEDQRNGWNAAQVSVAGAQALLEMLVDGENVKDAARAWLKFSASADLFAHNARVQREAQIKVDDLAMLVRQLVHSIRKTNPDNETASRAMDYFKRHGLQGSLLRAVGPAQETK
jgi:hypothetical protein